MRCSTKFLDSDVNRKGFIEPRIFPNIKSYIPCQTTGSITSVVVFMGSIWKPDLVTVNVGWNNILVIDWTGKCDIVFSQQHFELVILLHTTFMAEALVWIAMLSVVSEFVEKLVIDLALVLSMYETIVGQKVVVVAKLKQPIISWTFFSGSLIWSVN